MVVQQEPKKKICYECTLTRQGAQCQCVDWKAKFKMTKTNKQKKRVKVSQIGQSYSHRSQFHIKKKKKTKDAKLVT